MPQVSNPETSPQHSGIAAVLSGHGFDEIVAAVGPEAYVSAYQVLTGGMDNAKCKLQAALLICEAEPRDVHFVEGSPRKRKDPEASSQAVDCTLVDLTGPIKVTCWGQFSTRLMQYMGKNGATTKRTETVTEHP